VEVVLAKQNRPATVNTLVGVLVAGKTEQITNQMCFQGKLFRLNMSKTKGVNFRLPVCVRAQQKSLMKAQHKSLMKAQHKSLMKAQQKSLMKARPTKDILMG